MPAARSLVSFGSTTSVSGSPKRALNSMTFGPSAVAIRPAYRMPVNGVPSAAMASTVGRTIVSMAASTTSCPICGTGL